ncbi:MAG: CbtA family protein [Chloroflexi bacterium]|nr:CbtA family protein [Chloroflexota bacterium]
MTRILSTSIVMGVLVGLLVAAYMNIFNVPVMEWAIELEGCDRDRAGCAEQLAEAEEEDPLPLAFLTSLGVQRIGMSFGLAVIGILFGAIFAGLYHLMRNATPGWSPWAWAAVAGLLGFWGVSMYAQLKFPLNPPGIGEDSTLLARQGFQFLFMFVSGVAVALVIYGVGLVNRSSEGGGRWIRYAGVGIAYAVVALLLAYAVPSVRDAAPEWLPPGLTILFRTFTAVGHFLLWMGIAFATVGYRIYRERDLHAYPQSGVAAT